MLKVPFRLSFVFMILTLVQPLWARTGYDFGVDKAQYTCDREVSKVADFYFFKEQWDDQRLKIYQEYEANIREIKNDADRFYAPNKKWEAQSAASAVDRILIWVRSNEKIGFDATEFDSAMKMYDLAHEQIKSEKANHVNLNPSLLENTLGISNSQNLNLLYELALLDTKIEEARRDYLIRNVLNCKFNGVVITVTPGETR